MLICCLYCVPAESQELLQSQHKTYKAFVIFFYAFVSPEMLNKTVKRNTTLFAKLFI